jgi:hypothetical protein
MGYDVNIDSIRASEKQIEEGEGDAIKLKRARNLLNVSTRAPPEILGDIFAWSVFREDDYSLNTEAHFSGLRKGSYSFLLVFHHWFGVGSSTPELWGFWGNTLPEWNNRPSTWCSHALKQSRADNTVGEPLQDALRNHVTQDHVRQFHPMDGSEGLLSPIIFFLTPDDGVRCNSTESMDLHYWGGSTFDASIFFAQCHYVPTTILPSHRSLRTENSTLNNGDWGRLATCLTYRISDRFAPVVGGYFPHLCPEVAKEVEDLIGEFTWSLSRETRCHFGRCEGSGRWGDLQ